MTLARALLGRAWSFLLQPLLEAAETSDRDAMKLLPFVPGLQAEVVSVFLCLDSYIDADPRGDVLGVCLGGKNKANRKRLKPQGWEEELVKGS